MLHVCPPPNLDFPKPVVVLVAQGSLGSSLQKSFFTSIGGEQEGRNPAQGSRGFGQKNSRRLWRSRRPKGPNLEKFQDRLKFSISLENFNLSWKFQSWPPEFPTENRGLMGGALENFKILNFFKIWALGEEKIQQRSCRRGQFSSSRFLSGASERCVCFQRSGERRWATQRGPQEAPFSRMPPEGVPTLGFLPSGHR